MNKQYNKNEIEDTEEKSSLDGFIYVFFSSSILIALIFVFWELGQRI